MKEKLSGSSTWFKIVGSTSGQVRLRAQTSFPDATKQASGFECSLNRMAQNSIGQTWSFDFVILFVVNCELDMLVENK